MMTPRTSESHPLRIDVVEVPGTGGKIGMTLFPGRRDRLSADGAWERDVAADLAVIRAWRPAIVVSLVKKAEFRLLGVPDFASQMERGSKRGNFTWIHLPIRDAGVPDEAFETTWLDTGRAMRDALRGGDRVLLHCRAGLGRTGTIAARLLVELGVSSADAIAGVRRARSSHAIETEEQESHVRRQTPVDDAPPASRARALPPELQRRFLGSLLGGAIGDAMGAPFEMISSVQIERAIGSPVVRDFHEATHGSLLDPRAPGRPTDDTAMTIALLESLARSNPPLTISSIHTAMCAALARGNGPTAEMFWNGGPGGACIAMLRAARGGAGPVERLDPNAGGNGAAMRAHVCGLFSDRVFVAKFARLQARLSHPHPGAIAAAQTIALIAHDGFYTGKLTTDLPPEITEPTMVAAWKAAHSALERADRLPRHLRDVDMAGWNTVSVAHAIAQLYADDIESAIGFAAASGKDTDTVASMVGAMLGAVHRVAALPARWISGLHGHDVFASWAERMVAMAKTSLEMTEPFVVIG